MHDYPNPTGRICTRCAPFFFVRTPCCLTHSPTGKSDNLYRKQRYILSDYNYTQPIYTNMKASLYIYQIDSKYEYIDYIKL